MDCTFLKQRSIIKTPPTSTVYFTTTSRQNVLCCHNKSPLLWSIQCENIAWYVRLHFSSYFPSQWLLLSFMSIPASAVFPLLILIAVLRRSLFPTLQGSTETFQPVKILHLGYISHLSSIVSGFSQVCSNVFHSLGKVKVKPCVRHVSSSS